jgi:hypothetical protein
LYRCGTGHLPPSMCRCQDAVWAECAASPCDPGCVCNQVWASLHRVCVHAPCPARCLLGAQLRLLPALIARVRNYRCVLLTCDVRVCWCVPIRVTRKAAERSPTDCMPPGPNPQGRQHPAAPATGMPCTSRQVASTPARAHPKHQQGGLARTSCAVCCIQQGMPRTSSRPTFTVRPVGRQRHARSSWHPRRGGWQSHANRSASPAPPAHTTCARHRPARLRGHWACHCRPTACCRQSHAI